MLRRRPGYRRMWLGEVISALGDWLSYVALSVLVLERGGSALDLALVYAGHVLPGGLVAPLAGWLADRVERRALLVAVHAAQGVLMLGMLAAGAAGLLGWLPLLLFARSSLGGLVYPARQAALHQLVEPDELLTANTLDATSWSVTFTLGTALGGALAMIDPLLALGLDALTFALAAGLLRGLPLLPVAGSSRSLVEAFRRMGSDLREAIELIRRRTDLREAALAKAPVAMAAGGGWLVMTLAAGELQAGVSAAAALGALQGLRGIGTAFGSLLADKLVARGHAADRLLRVVNALSLLAIAAYVLTDQLGWLALWVVAWGAGSGANWVLSSSETQRLAPADAAGRMAALEVLGYALGQSGVALLAAVCIDRGLARAAAGLIAVALGAGAMIALTWRRPHAHPSLSSAMLS